jgi:outer membrane protein TolC
MSRNYSFHFLTLIGALIGYQAANAQQVLTLKDAVQTALQNYPAIKAKANYANSSKATVEQTKKEYLPDLAVSFQHDYGTVNGSTGPLYALRGISSASSGGAPLDKQNWHAAFGALYLTNINWDFYSFGRAKEKIKTAEALVARDESDLTQEQFQHEVRVSAAYLNLLAAQRLTQSWQNNLDRAVGLQGIVTTRVKNGLNAGVDSSLANAEVSGARIVLTRAKDYEQEQANQLAILMGVPDQAFTLDTLFVARIPGALYDSASKQQQHPLLAYFQRRIDLSNEQAKYFKTFSYPTFTLFGVFQGRGSGFDYNYGTAGMDHYTQDYFSGINPNRYNYLLGVGMVWNLTTPLRVQHQVNAQKYISRALKDEYDLTDQRLKAQMSLAENKIKNALDNYREAPVQVKAASDAYTQKSVLYRNGLTNMVDVTQTLYALNRAETDRAIAYNNVWQALLLKAAATGDFALFINEF